MNDKFLDQVDCGIKALNCCNTKRCRQLGTTRTFLIVLIILAIVQGVSEKFIAISANQAALEHDFDPDVVGELSFNQQKRKLCVSKEKNVKSLT